MGKNPPETVAIARPALNGTGGKKPGHVVAGNAPAGPILAGRVLTELVELRRVDAEEPDAIAGEPQAVAVAGARPAGNRLGEPFEKARGKGDDSQKDEHRERAGQIAKSPASTKTERQGFTRC